MMTRRCIAPQENALKGVSRVVWLDDIITETWGEGIETEAPRKIYKVAESGERLGTVLGGKLPSDTVLKCISKPGGFSAVAFVLYVAEKEPIEQLYVSSLRIGKKELAALDELHKMDRLQKAHFLTGDLMRQNAQYDYADILEMTCQENGWTTKHCHNHSKVILMRTAENFYVVETSANMNTNPQMEQFSFENCEELFNFYQKHVFSM